VAKVALVQVVLAGALCAAVVLAGEGSAEGWRVLAGAAEPPAKWSQPGFDDSGWPVAVAGVGGAPGGTVLLRRELLVPDPARVTGLTVEVAAGGPFAVFLNGVEVLRSPRPLPYRSDPPTGQLQGFTVDLGGLLHELLPGTNVLAVEAVGLVAPPSVRLTTGSGSPAAEVLSELPAPPVERPAANPAGSGPRFAVLLVCDGCGPLHLQAANLYSGITPDYQVDPRWSKGWVSTFPHGGSYDGGQAWTDFTYPLRGTTDSAAAATAMVTGRKTANGRVSVDAGGATRLASVGERARPLGIAVGAVTTVPVSHATPAALTSHNLLRGNTYAIADEAVFGDPNTTGTVAVDPKYGGGFGSTLPVTDVLVGGRGDGYVHPLQRDRLAADSGLPGRHRLVEGQAGVDGGAALLAAAADPDCTMLAGLFDRPDLRVTAPGGGYLLETPSLAQSTAAALTVLERSAGGFVLMVEGGAVDWAAHANDMDWVLGELLDFALAVETVVSWVDDPATAATWDTTLVVVTADHETAYLTAAPGVFPGRPLAPGSVTDATLALEKVNLDTGRRASWVDDDPPNDRVDPGETVYWAWNSGGHSNTLVPLFARGAAADRFRQLAVHADPVRGPYVDNTELFAVIVEALGADALFADGFESGDVARWSGGTGPL